MRILMQIDIPHEPFNTYVREGTAGNKIGRVLEETNPEVIYFSEHAGTRGAVAVYDLEEAAQIPKLAEPWFLSFNANCRFRIAMTPEDLKKAGLDDMGKRWSK